MCKKHVLKGRYGHSAVLFGGRNQRIQRKPPTMAIQHTSMMYQDFNQACIRGRPGLQQGQARVVAGAGQDFTPALSRPGEVIVNLPQKWHNFKFRTKINYKIYRNDLKFSDRQVWANNVDPDQTATRGAVWSGSTLFAIPPASFGAITLT